MRECLLPNSQSFYKPTPYNRFYFWMFLVKIFKKHLIKSRMWFNFNVHGLLILILQGVSCTALCNCMHSCLSNGRHTHTHRPLWALPLRSTEKWNFHLKTKVPLVYLLTRCYVCIVAFCEQSARSENILTEFSRQRSRKANLASWIAPAW
jgi:hypothetical protein